MKKYSLFLILSLFLAVSSVKAQENLSNEENTLEDVDFDELPAKIRLPYAYPFTLEWNIGHSRNIHSYSRAIPDRGLSSRADTRGVDMTWRFTGFFSKHWGAFASANIGIYHVSAGKTERTLENHYGRGRYRYINLAREELYCWENAEDDGGGSFNAWYMAGPAYRYDVGQWSFRGRLGIGLGEIHPQHAEYLRTDGEAINMRETPEYQRFDVLMNKDSRCQNYFKTFAYSPSVQVTFTPRRTVYFSFEMSFLGNIGHAYERIETFETSLSESHGDWIGEIIRDMFFFIPFENEHEHDGYRYVVGKKTSTEYYRLHPGNFLNFNVGIGWNIGHNKNEKRMKK